MSTIDIYCECLAFNRGRTLGLLEQLEQTGDASGPLSWRPGPDRAPIAWQLMHIGITEELFATERLRPGVKPSMGDLVERFRGGSTPDDDTPSSEQIRQVLDAARTSLLATIGGFSDAQLDDIVFPQRDWKLHTVLQVLGWHEAHHQGQAHLTFNLWRQQHA